MSQNNVPFGPQPQMKRTVRMVEGRIRITSTKPLRCLLRTVLQKGSKCAPNVHPWMLCSLELNIERTTFLVRYQPRTSNELRQEETLAQPGSMKITACGLQTNHKHAAPALTFKWRQTAHNAVQTTSTESDCILAGASLRDAGGKNLTVFRQTATVGENGYQPMSSASQ